MRSRNLDSTLATNFSGKNQSYFIRSNSYRIIKMFLEGKSFPTGGLPLDKQRQHVYDIVNVITND